MDSDHEHVCWQDDTDPCLVELMKNATRQIKKRGSRGNRDHVGDTGGHTRLRRQHSVKKKGLVAFVPYR